MESEKRISYQFMLPDEKRWGGYIHRINLGISSLTVNFDKHSCHYKLEETSRPKSAFIFNSGTMHSDTQIFSYKREYIEYSVICV